MRFAIKAVTFLAAFTVCIIASAIVWQVVFPGHIYNFTDDNLFGFFRPGNWVHHEFVSVPKINASDSMSMPDSIKVGWTVGKLWCAWWIFIGASFLFSFRLSFLLWRPRKLNVS
jgi:hypothetical protein